MRRILVPLLLGVFAVGAVLVTMARSYSNCGGNSEALAHVQVIGLVAETGMIEAPDGSFHFATASGDRAWQLRYFAERSRDKRARYLVSNAPVTESETEPRRVIIVCDTPYRNVPERLIGSAPPTHAAGFADGNTGLISTAEFAALDLSSFTPLDELYPAADDKRLAPEPK